MHISMMQFLDFCFGIVWCWQSIFCFQSLVSLPHMSIGARIIISVTFHQVDHTPDSKACSDCNYQSLKDIHCTRKKAHFCIDKSTFSAGLSVLLSLLSSVFRPLIGFSSDKPEGSSPVSSSLPPLKKPLFLNGLNAAF